MKDSVHRIVLFPRMSANNSRFNQRFFFSVYPKKKNFLFLVQMAWKTIRQDIQGKASNDQKKKKMKTSVVMVVRSRFVFHFQLYYSFSTYLLLTGRRFLQRKVTFSVWIVKTLNGERHVPWINRNNKTV